MFLSSILIELEHRSSLLLGFADFRSLGCYLPAEPEEWTLGALYVQHTLPKGLTENVRGRRKQKT